jgi:hypothetical protein
MLGKYQNFPAAIHWTEQFLCPISNRQLQQKIIQLFFEINQKNFSFEEAANPTVPDCTLIFEFGLAEGDGFSFIDEEETKKILALKDALHLMDFFCSIRYYKNADGKKTPLKFDYYLMRLIFSKGEVEFQIFHERGPRYISPEDLTLFIANRANEGLVRKILKRKETENPE